MYDDLEKQTKREKKVISVNLDKLLLNEVDTFLKKEGIKRNSFIEYLFKKFLEENLNRKAEA